MCDALDVQLTWLLNRLDRASLVTSFAIARDAADCRTPRRNAQTEEALAFFRTVFAWSERVQAYLTGQVFPIQTSGGLQQSLITDEHVFVPVVPLFVRGAAAVAVLENSSSTSSGGALVQLSAAAQRGATLSNGHLRLFLDEERRSLAERVAELSKAFPSAQEGNLVTIAEASAPERVSGACVIDAA